MINSLFISIGQDLRFALRQLRRSPGFTGTAVLTLGLGIGATTAMYGVIHRVLLQPLPYPAQEQLVGLGWKSPGDTPEAEQTGETADFLLAHARSFSIMGVADDGPLGANLSTGDGKPVTIRSLRVSEGWLRTLGVTPQMGREFTREEDLAGGPAVAIVSYTLWKNRLNSDLHAVGRVIRVNGEPYTIVGVMPKSFAEVEETDLWRPLRLGPSDPGYRGDNFQMIARLKPRVSLEQARAEMETLTPAIYSQYPDYKNWFPAGHALLQQRVWFLHDVMVSHARSSLISLMGAVAMVLLVACLNVAGLMTVRSLRRRREIAVRMALGAKRTDVVRLLMAESVWLAAGGAITGVACALGLERMIRIVAPITARRLNPGAGITDQSWWTLTVALAIGLVTTLIFGLLPAMGLLRRDVSKALSGTHTVGETASTQRAGRLLVVGQIALAMMLLSASALLLGTFLKMRSIPPGVATKQLEVLQVNLKGDSFASAEKTRQFIDRLEERLRRIPSVSQVATVNGLPLDRGLNMTAWPDTRKESRRNVDQRFITPGYFHTVGTPLLAGRDISIDDRADGEKVTLVSQRMAELWWPNRSPIGEYVSQDREKWRVIGVVADVHDRSLTSDMRPTWYVSYSQVDDKAVQTINGWFPTSFVIRTAKGVPIATEVARALHDTDPEVPIAKFREMQGFIDDTIAAPRFFSWMSGAFALFALLFTGVGLFGLLSYQVGSRTKEIGVRMAMGATREKILFLVVHRGIELALTGLALGLMGSMALRRGIEGILADTVHSTTTSLAKTITSESVALTCAAATIFLTAVFASGLPARRAASIEPTEALRTE